MKPTSPSLRLLLETGQFLIADLYTFTNVGTDLGTTATLRYASSSFNVSANGFDYSCGGAIGPYFNRTDNKAKVRQARGVGNDTLTFDVMPGDAQLFGISFLKAIRYGAFAGAELQLERCFMPYTPGALPGSNNWIDTSRGTIIQFAGRVGNIDAGRTVATFTINSHLELLDTQWPRNLIQPGCRNNFTDVNCTVGQPGGPALPTTTGTVVSATNNYQFGVSLNSGPFNIGTFDLGLVTFNSGALVNVKKSVKSVVFGSPNTLTLIGWTTRPPAVGDTFTITYGCDRTYGVANLLQCWTANGANFIEAATYVGLSNGMKISGTGVPSPSYISDIVPNVPSVFGQSGEPELVTRLYLTSGTTTATGSPVLTVQSVNGCIKFNNQNHFSGEWAVPQPQTAI